MRSFHRIKGIFLTLLSTITLVCITLLLGCLGEESQMPTLLSFEDQLKIDVATIDAHLAAEDTDVLVHESDIRYTVQQEGEGESPTLQNTVEVKYKGSFLNGEVFDETKGDATIAFPLSNLIAAWQIMIPTMKEGGTITIYTPSVYAYGVRGAASIPPNTNLIFEITLVSFE